MSSVGFSFSMLRKIAAVEAFSACIALGVSSSSTSRVRDLPEPGSGDSSAMRGVDSNESTVWQCAAHSVTATAALSDGNATNRPMKA